MTPHSSKRQPRKPRGRIDGGEWTGQPNLPPMTRHSTSVVRIKLTPLRQRLLAESTRGFDAGTILGTIHRAVTGRNDGALYLSAIGRHALYRHLRDLSSVAGASIDRKRATQYRNLSDQLNRESNRDVTTVVDNVAVVHMV